MSQMGWFVEGLPKSRLVPLDAGDAAQDELAQLLLAVPGDAGHADDLTRVDHQVDLLQADLGALTAGTRLDQFEHRRSTTGLRRLPGARRSGQHPCRT